MTARLRFVPPPMAPEHEFRSQAHVTPIITLHVPTRVVTVRPFLLPTLRDVVVALRPKPKLSLVDGSEDARRIEAARRGLETRKINQETRARVRHPAAPDPRPRSVDGALVRVCADCSHGPGCGVTFEVTTGRALRCQGCIRTPSPANWRRIYDRKKEAAELDAEVAAIKAEQAARRALPSTGGA